MYSRNNTSNNQQFSDGNNYIQQQNSFGTTSGVSQPPQYNSQLGYQPVGFDKGANQAPQGQVPPQYQNNPADNSAYGETPASSQQFNYPPYNNYASGYNPPPQQWNQQPNQGYGYQSPDYQNQSYGYQNPDYQNAGGYGGNYANYPPQGGYGYDTSAYNPQTGYTGAAQQPQQFGYNDYTYTGNYQPDYQGNYNPQGQYNTQYQQNNNSPQPQQTQAKKPKLNLSIDINENTVAVVLGCVLLPVLFVLSLVIPGVPLLKWIYVGACVAGMGVYWARRSCQNPSMRITMTAVHAVMCIIAIITAVTASPVTDKVNSPNSAAPSSQQSSADQGSSAQNDAPDSLFGGFVAEETPMVEDNNSVFSSAAADVVNSFMYLWERNSQESMLTYCSPKWAKSQEKPEVTLFSILATRIPTDYTIEKISGTDNDLSRTATVTASIVRQGSNSTAEKYRYQIILTRENDAWYIDPSSLKSNEKTETPGPSSEPTQAVDFDVTPDPNIILYINPDGGKLYHIDPNCSSIDSKYRPLTSSFPYSQINDSAYSKYTKCPTCKAPRRVK